MLVMVIGECGCCCELEVEVEVEVLAEGKVGVD